ncbi:hypothetical protein C1645_818991 [Glomus cerebriforme]|uniref:Uncharacterized protein n=1 Tax=Glomus cerebriforme TaxID=658196 RepID=A0A397T6A5_9GLOM|nr:hypothetical protein C1645_818991 [Glomus cerebriforme]
MSSRLMEGNTRTGTSTGGIIAAGLSAPSWSRHITRSYIPDPLKPDLYWDKLLAKYSHNAQEVNTDSQMYDMLGNRYQQWQVWFENPIGFDEVTSI